MAVGSQSELAAEVERLRAELARREHEAADKERQLERYAADLRETFKELRRSYVATVRALSNAVEARDAYTGKHAERVAAYGLLLARAVDAELASDPELEFGFLLHDIGKVAIADAILWKPSALTDEERAVMETHPEIGAHIVGGIDFLGDAVQIVVRSHHERWDGRGYPDRLAGETIPLAARVFSVADVLDALTTTRPYRPASSFPVARAMILAASGQQFDPDVIAAFNTIEDQQFERIAAELE